MSARALAVAALLLTTTGEAAAQEGCLSPELMVVLDTSGSMKTLLADGATTRRDGAMRAIIAFASAYDARFRFSLVTFPGGAPTSESPCGSGVVALRPGSSSDQLIDAVSSAGLAGGTPTALALEEARRALAGVPAGRPRFVVLVTDGAPNCNPALDPAGCFCTCIGLAGCDCGVPLNCLDDLRTNDAVERLAADGVPTFVVGFGGVPFPGVMARLAQLGGTAREGGTAFYDAADEAALARAFDDIVVASAAPTRPCTTACGVGAQQCLADSWGACDGPMPGDLVPCVETGCAGRRLCTEGGFGPCEELPVGSLVACEGPCGEGRGTCTGPSVVSACDAAREGDLRRCKGDDAFCGGGDQFCTAEGWTACSAPRLGDVRACPREAGGCADVQRCEQHGWTVCNTARAGEALPCSAPCGAGERTCGADGAFGPCVATEIGLLRSCERDEPSCEQGVQECLEEGWSSCAAPVLGDREACEGICGAGERMCLGAEWSACETPTRPCYGACERGGQQVCNDDGWSECFCFEAPTFLADEEGCGCGATTSGAPGGVLALLVGAALLQRRAAR